MPSIAALRVTGDANFGLRLRVYTKILRDAKKSARTLRWPALLGSAGWQLTPTVAATRMSKLRLLSQPLCMQRDDEANGISKPPFYSNNSSVSVTLA